MASRCAWPCSRPCSPDLLFAFDAAVLVVPGARDLEDVDVLAGVRQRLEGTGELHHAYRGIVEDLAPARALDEHAFHAAVARHRHGHDQAPAQALAARLLGEVEVADALDLL